MELMATKYKTSELGKIPSDWHVLKLSSLGQFYKGKGIKKDEVSPDGLKCVRYGELYTHYNNIIKHVKSHIPNEVAASSFKIQQGDILFAGSGETREEIGKSAALLTSETVYAGGDIVILRPRNNDSQLLGYLLNANIISKQKSLRGQGDAVVHIYPKGLGEILVPLPPTLTEQKAIAKALSDVDELITKLEKLIEKKKAIKQGAVQELFQPKRNWKTQPIREVAKYRRGSFPQPYGLAKWYDDISGTPFVQVVDVDDNKRLKKETKARISKEGEKFSVFVPKGTIILTIQGSIGRICITEYDAYVDRTLLIFESFLADFDKYFFMMSIFLKFEIEKEKAPGGIIKTITKQALSSFEISYPSLEEQLTISDIIQSMDSEIELLGEKLSKLTIIKQGMMQELLTGKTRLI